MTNRTRHARTDSVPSRTTAHLRLPTIPSHRACIPAMRTNAGAHDTVGRPVPGNPKTSEHSATHARTHALTRFHRLKLRASAARSAAVFCCCCCSSAAGWLDDVDIAAALVAGASVGADGVGADARPRRRAARVRTCRYCVCLAKPVRAQMASVSVRLELLSE